MKCWICNRNKADSGEHKFKSSFLKKFHGKPFKETVDYIVGGKSTRIGSSNNQKVKFPKVICEECNNSNTSKHDYAFEKLISYSLENYNLIFKNKSINFELVYGNNWFEEKRSLYKYLAKHAGCKIVTSELNFDVNKLSDFIYKDIDTTSFQIKFQLKEGFKVLDYLLKEKESDGLNFMSNSETFCCKKKDEIVYFAGMTSYNWFSINWVYSQNNYLTNFENFTCNSLMPVSFMPYNLNLGDGDENWIDFFDKQGIEDDAKKMDFYNSMVNFKNS